MASVTQQPQSESSGPQQPSGGNPLVDKQIRRTRRALKMVDWSAGLITLLIGTLLYLLTVAVLEHWVVPGGWGATGRLALFGLLLVGIAWYSWRTFWPLLRQPINPVYAAQTIEESSPSLKNSLLNLLLLRGHKRELPRQVYHAIEQQAEQRLSQVRLETVVDRSAVLRLGYILVAVVALCVLYRFLSPKDLFSSAGRVLAPWANIAAPSRVEILDITPGDTKVARGEQLEITAEVLGLEEDEPVRLFYSTADEQIVGQELPMLAAAGGARYKCRVPRGGRLGSSGGIQQDFSYWIEAGDARSPRYNVSVFAKPTMVVNRIRYEYPAYTGYPSRNVEHTGDVRAVEGTKVTVFAIANKPIKTAHVDFEADGRRDLLMNANELQATVTFPLELREDRRTPKHQSYVLRYTTDLGHKNLSPPKYQIEVVPDYSPEIQLLLPEEAVLDVALNQEVNFELEARDPDFALRQVVLLGKVGQEQVLKETLLAKNHTGRFVGKLRKTPAELGLKVGDVLEYWGAAADVRRPQANLAYSVHRKIRVIDPWQGDQPGQEGEQQRGEQPGEGAPQEGEGGNEEGQAGGGEQASAGEGEGDTEGASGAGQESGEQGDQNSEQPGGQGGEGDQEGENSNPQGGGEADPADGSEGQSDSPNENGEPGEGGGESGEQGKVSAEGDDDGSAFERIADHFDETDGKTEGAGNGAEGDQQSRSGGQNNEGSPEGDQAGEGGEESEAQEGEQSAGQKGEQQERSGETEGAAGEPAPGEEEREGAGGGEEQPEQENGADEGRLSPEQGDAGAGEQSGERQGTPEQDIGKKPRDKQEGQEGESGQQNQEAASKANDRSESDSEGGQGGDRSGGGQEGAGQQADEKGTGAAGENQAADQGAGQAQESGEGEAGQQPGDKQIADDKTGESSGDQPGQGSEQAQQEGQQSGGEKANEGATGEQQGSEQAEGQPAEAGGAGGSNSPPPPPEESLPGDEANLEYAKKRTDLILDRLEDQLKKKQVDKSLLEKLGWTQDELQRFVDRWKGLKAAEESGSVEAQKELDDALRSLGLSPKGRTGFGSKVTKDKLRDLRDAYRGRAPLEFQQQIRAYVKGTAAAGESE